MPKHRSGDELEIQTTAEPGKLNLEEKICMQHLSFKSGTKVERDRGQRRREKSMVFQMVRAANLECMSVSPMHSRFAALTIWNMLSRCAFCIGWSMRKNKL